MNMSTPLQAERWKFLPKLQRIGKGIAAEAQTFPTALGIQANTCMTVTFREALFIHPHFGYCFITDGDQVTALFFGQRYHLEKLFFL